MKSNNNLSVNLNSEIGDLEGVIIHTLGSEVENMTPENAERALYSDILNLSVAQTEYAQLSGILKKVAPVFEVKDLLASVLEKPEVRTKLLKQVCKNCSHDYVGEYLVDLKAQELARQLIEGVVLERDSLSRFLSHQRFAIRPLHNFFFTRDASVAMYDKVLLGKMASKVRERESQIMDAIFTNYEDFNTSTFTTQAKGVSCDKISIEGGDVLIGREDLLVIGISNRTTSHGIDVVIEKLRHRKQKQHIIVQELPTDLESFIHLDMVFTFLSQDECMVYEPVIMQPNRYKTIHITTENGKVRIKEEKNILEVLTKIGMPMKPIYCGGRADLWTQEREQWHSGANFFAIGPGKVIGYNRNVNTIEELNKNGYEVIKASHVLKEKVNLDEYQKYVVTIEGSELARGGGGARCMTMPFRRKNIKW
jgi:arginine deiminase